MGRTRCREAPVGQRQRVPVVLAALSCAVAIGACGGSRGSAPIGSTYPASANSPLAFSHCMRAHGVTYLPGGGGPAPPISAGQKAAAIANARCMRAHGVPSFPDPQFPAGGGIAIKLGSGVAPQSPAFRRAWAACGGGRP